MVMFKPDASFDLAIAANSGWYTTPDNEQNYPYGISGAPKLQDRITHSLQRPLIVFLGTEDKPGQGGFRTRSEAMKQGESRPQRGEHFFSIAHNTASSLGLNLGWQLKYADGIATFYQETPEHLKTEEVPRMEKVMKSFSIIKKVEIAIFILGLILTFAFWHNELVKGVAIGLILMSFSLYIFDHIAESRGEPYIHYLKSL
jgi:hypothetical protein